MIKRCDWCLGHELYIEYHDKEWGRPVYDDQKLFEFLLLEGAQAGLSWLTILKKRENYRMAFDGFDPFAIAGYDQNKIDELMEDKGIIRNKLKIDAFITNSRIYIKEFYRKNSFSDFLWSYTGHKQIMGDPETTADIPVVSEEAEKMSRALKTLGFKFTGPVICYSFMQAVGMVNDHLISCFWRDEVCQR
jgi:DNA-3-methyladenine glycosylase I